jgi:site-specific DNA recombinase
MSGTGKGRISMTPTIAPERMPCERPAAGALRAAVYARKSTDQSDRADEAKSVTRQVEHARQYAEGKGWAVVDEHVYIDDGISGAEFAKRPGFLRLMNALKPSPPFQVLIMSEESRLGREAIETAYALKQLVQSGVRVFFYLSDIERTLNSPMEKAMLAVQAMADELEREKARQRVRDAMSRTARAGHVTGGKTFGYDNVTVSTADGKRSHVERRINEQEAAVVRRIFELSAAGSGYSRIAKLLNAERSPAPRPKCGRPIAWSPSTVKVIIDRRMYLGELTWNRREKRDAWGQRALRIRPQSEWITASAPELRIVTDGQWRAAHDRIAAVREQLRAVSSTPSGRPRLSRDVDSPYLLSGFCRCGACGGGLAVVGGSHKTGRPHSYGCLSYHKRGRTICDNALKVRASVVDDAVLRAIGGDVLRPAVVAAVLHGVFAALRPEARSAARERLRAELASVEREIGRVTEAIATGGDLAPLLEALKTRQARQVELRAAIETADWEQAPANSRRAVEAAVRERLARWREMLTGHVAEARELLRETLAGPIRFTPRKQAYEFAGELSLGGLLVGTICLPTNLVPVRGFEPRFRG